MSNKTECSIGLGDLRWNGEEWEINKGYPMGDVSLNKIIKKLNQYEDAEVQGLILRLPCKVGDTVYVVLPGVKEVMIGDVRKMSFNKNNDLVICIGRTQGKNYITGNHRLSSFGKTIFLSKREAQEALEENNEQ